MEIIIVAGVSIAIVGFFVYGMYSNKKRKEAVWSGIVVDKNILEIAHDNNSNQNNNGVNLFSMGNNGSQTTVTHNYSIKVKTESGDQINWPISSGLYEAINIGDKLTKSVGTDVPEIIEKAATSSQSQINNPVAASPQSSNTAPPTPPIVPSN